MKTHKRLTVALIAVGALCLSGLASAQADQPVRNWIGKKLDYKMTSSSGKTITDESNKGKVVLLDFWATWCGPCKAASPFVQELHEKYAKDGLVVIGANAWERSNQDTAAAKYAKDHSYTYTMTIKNDDLAKKLGITGIPTFVLIGEDGVIQEVFVGFAESSKATMEKAVRAALSK